jgi:hypothetical protein
MRPVRIITAIGFAAALAVAGCAAQRTAVHSSAAPAPAATPVATTAPAPPVTLTTPRRAPTPTDPRLAPKPKSPTAPPRLYFATPQAAMRYLTVAYNHNDLVALGHVTTPVARANLLAMHRTAVDLQLAGCTAQPARGDSLCTFTHDYPPAMHVTGQGRAHFLAAPADEHGWYMTVLQDCS